MSQYVDSSYYYDVYGGELIPPEYFDKKIKEASEKIDEVTFNRIVKIGFNNLTDFQKEKVKESVCAQADYIYENGYGSDGDIASYSVLDITITEKNSDSEANKLNMSSYAYDQIKKTGLTCRSFRW